MSSTSEPISPGAGSASSSGLAERGYLESVVRSIHLLLIRLGRRPALLVAVAIAANALFQPYQNRSHDARLYGLQVINQATGGSYQDDLFLKYGSQDNYSIFSRLASPLVRHAGVKNGFLILYGVCSLAYFTALMCLLAMLTTDPAIRTLSMLVVAVVPTVYGGYDLFHIHESFFTPRLPASALVMVALSEILGRRPGRAAGWLVLALVVHPLMAVGGWLIWGFALALRWLPTRPLVILSSVAVAVVVWVLCDSRLGGPLFGIMDDVWYLEAVQRGPHLLGTRWSPEEWLRILVPTALVGWSWNRAEPGTPRRRFLAGVLGMSIVATIGVLAASIFPYALLIQGQPFRAYWILHLIQIPLTWMFVSDAFASRRIGRILFGVGLLWLVCVPWSERAGLDLALLCYGPLFVLIVFALSRGARRPEALGLAVGAALLAGGVTRMMISYSHLVGLWSTLDRIVPADNLIAAALETVDASLRVPLALGATWALTRLAGWGRPAIGLSLAFGATLTCGSVVLAQNGFPEGWSANPIADDLRFVRDAIERQRATEGDGPDRPVVYWPAFREDAVWIDLEANNYFVMSQLGGVVFNRGTAIEGRRRKPLVRTFEAERVRRIQILLSDRQLARFNDSLAMSIQEPDPNAEDVLTLCRDPQLDYAVLRIHLPEWAAATNGRWSLYDARAIRRTVRDRGEDGPRKDGRRDETHDRIDGSLAQQLDGR